MAKLLSVVDVEASTGVLFEAFSFAIGGIQDCGDVLLSEELLDGLSDFVESCREEGAEQYELKLNVRVFSYSEEEDEDEESEDADDILLENFDALDYGLMSEIQCGETVDWIDVD